MNLKSITWQNLRSFGQDKTTLTFDPSIGELILIYGKNGGGKSTISDAIDLNLYGKVKDKKGGIAKIGSVPNWYNKSCVTEGEWESNGSIIDILRSYQPNSFQIFEDSIPYDKKIDKQTYVESINGMNFKMWRNYVNISFSDFKDFMSLTPADKRELIDKLFNLSEINELLEITKEIKKGIEADLKVIEKNIESNKYSINKLELSIKQSEIDLQAAETKNEEFFKSEINRCKAEIQTLKEKNIELKAELEPLVSKLDKALSLIEKHSNEIRDNKNDLTQLQNNIALYEAGRCHTCGHEYNKPTDKETHKSLLDCKAKLLDKTSLIENKLQEIKLIKSTTEKAIADLNISINKSVVESKQYQTTGKHYSELLNKPATDKSDFQKAIENFKTSVNELKDKETQLVDTLNTFKEDLLILDKLTKLLGEKGIKQDFVQNLVPTINHWVDTFSKLLVSDYDVSFDENFEAIVKNMNQEVDMDCLSKGQAKKLNIAILLACIKIMRMQKSNNILFLDETFDGIDIDNIDHILRILKDFANEHLIHIMVIHHASLEHHHFDRIFKVEKTIFSELIQIK